MGTRSGNLQRMERTYLIRTFGCQMNEHDSERIAGMLVAEGMEPTAELAQIVEIIDSAKSATPEEQIELAKELYGLWVEQGYELGLVGLTPMVQGVVVVNNHLHNLPLELGNDWPLRTPGNARPEQWYFDNAGAN